MEEKLNVSAIIQSSTSEFFLEYYLMKNTESNYGFKIEKKEKKAGTFILCEDYTSNYTFCNKEEATAVIEKLAKNVVTPTTANCILHDLGYI